MGAVTFNSIKEYAKRHGVTCERKGKEYEAYRNNDHGTVAVALNLRELLDEVNSFIDVKIPDIYSRRIYWFQTKSFRGHTAVVMIIGEGYNRVLTRYQRLIEVARQTFPDIKDEEIELASVIDSPTIKHHPLIVFPVKVEKGFIPGYTGYEHGEPVGFSY